ncbi:hypothetical protein Pint_27323 [Pistacia integerrima]|uniref:Uncharacterized protein n=1 Tax=Pistacia integerrima TaxID=434235 RepID=A0ACC0YPV7_9ROSI|nr:hypothetical protein Pint_27323 [Pistacia integerrima]
MDHRSPISGLFIRKRVPGSRAVAEEESRDVDKGFWRFRRWENVEYRNVSETVRYMQDNNATIMIFHVASDIKILGCAGSICHYDPDEWPIIEPLSSYGRGRERLGGRHISLIHGDGLTNVVITVALAVRHGQGSSSRSNSSNRKPLYSSYCDRDHHVRETCWKLNGYPPEHPKYASNRSNQGHTHFKRNHSHQSSVNNVKESPIMQEVPSVTNGLSDLQIQQILSIMRGKGTTQSPILKLILLPQFVTKIVTPPSINYRQWCHRSHYFISNFACQRQ